MKPYRSFILIAAVLMCAATSQAQKYYGPPPPVYYGPPPYYGGGMMYVRPAPRPHYRQQPHKQPKAPPFTPSVNVTLGYGFPNLDQYQLVDFQGVYRGNVQQTGPVNASIDYQFSRFMSIGILGMYGKVKTPYYNYSNGSRGMTGSLENWAIMANWMNYMPVSKTVEPYLRIAMGVNIWNQNYYDYDAGAKANYVQRPSDFAYQFSFGSKFFINKQTAFFIEGGYGKYILNGGLSFKL